MRARLRATVALLVLGALAGCVSLKRTAEARFFALRPVAEAPMPAAAENDASIVGVLPVFLPGHLERPQFITWSGPGEVRIDEFLRWAEPLDSGVLRVLAEDLGTLLPSHRVIKAPWPGSTPLRCRVRAELVRFGPQPGGEVSLSGRFVLLPARGERALLARSVDLVRVPAPDASDPGQSVETMSTLLADLAAQIADAIASLPIDPSEKVSATTDASEVVQAKTRDGSRDFARSPRRATAGPGPLSCGISGFHAAALSMRLAPCLPVSLPGGGKRVIGRGPRIGRPRELTH